MIRITKKYIQTIKLLKALKVLMLERLINFTHLTLKDTVKVVRKCSDHFQVNHALSQGNLTFNLT